MPLEADIQLEFRALFDAQLDYVCRSLRRMGVAEGDVPDLAQEVFVTVHRRFHEYDRARPVRPWLASFVVRLAANYRRLARHRHERSADGLDEPHATSTPEQDALANEARRTLQAALETLPFERRAVLVLCDLDGLEGNEVAEALAIPRNTVYSRLRVAREELAQALRRRPR